MEPFSVGLLLDANKRNNRMAWRRKKERKQVEEKA